MTALTITGTDVHLVVGDNEHQITAPCGEAFDAGQYVRLDGSTGKLVLGNASASGEVGYGFISLVKCAAGETATAVRGPCVISVGEAVAALNYGAAVYLSDTDGTLADGAGTVSTVVGHVVPGWAYTTADKLLRIDL